MERLQIYTPTAARVLLALVFVVTGLGKITGWSTQAAWMESKGLPLVLLLLFIASLIELGGAASLLLGYKVRWAAPIMFLYLIPVTFVMHDFWSMEGMQRTMQMFMFLKNLAIMGGLLLLVSAGSGPYSLDGSGRR